MEDYLKLNRRIKKYEKFESAIKELDIYISKEEEIFGEIRMVEYEITPRCQPKISKSLIDLKIALNKDKTEKEEAYEYLKKSNNTMKKIMKKLQKEMKLSRENIRTEIMNFDNLNTERLLSINAKNFVINTERRK